MRDHWRMSKMRIMQMSTGGDGGSDANPDPDELGDTPDPGSDDPDSSGSGGG